jgi:pilus assembly protein Flp/PilA
LSILTRLLNDTRGATSIEYGLIVALIATGLVVGLGLLGDQVAASYDDLAVKVETASGPN